MKGRKPLATDVRVLAALENLKSACMAVNGDTETKNVLALVEVVTGETNNQVFAAFHICNCPACIQNIRRTINRDLDAAAADYAKAPKVVH